MKNIYLIGLIICLSASVSVQAQEYSWSREDMDGSRTGCVSTMKDNVVQSLGMISDGVYFAPNGKVYDSTTSTAKVAAMLIQAQPRMGYVKTVIAYSPELMKPARPESALSNWCVDLVMDKVSKLSGKKVDVGICNFGGIRTPMPQGDVILDDILSMFPFDNNLYYLEIYGKDLRQLFGEMADRKAFEPLGGVQIKYSGTDIISVTVAGEPLQDDKLYSVATISFLYKGGDNIMLSPLAVTAQMYDVFIREAVLEHIYDLTARKKDVTYRADGRIVEISR